MRKYCRQPGRAADAWRCALRLMSDTDPKDIGKYAELLILGVLNFARGVLRTHYYYLFRPTYFCDLVGIPSRTIDDINARPEGFTRPLTFLFFNLLLLFVAFPAIFDLSVPGALGPDGLASPLGKHLGQLKSAVSELKTYESILLVLPFVLWISIVTLIQHFLIKVAFRSHAAFGQLMCVNSYGFGVLAFQIFVAMCMAINVQTKLHVPPSCSVRIFLLVPSIALCIVYLISIYRFSWLLGFFCGNKTRRGFTVFFLGYIGGAIASGLLLTVLPISAIFSWHS